MSETPAWLTSLLESVGNCIEAHGPPTSIRYRWWTEDDDEFWEVWVYPTLVELVGGAVDGEVVSPGFSLDLQALSSLLDEVTDFNWQAQTFGPHDILGPNVSIEGTYRGHEVYIQVLCEAPEDEEPGMEFEVQPQSD